MYVQHKALTGSYLAQKVQGRIILTEMLTRQQRLWCVQSTNYGIKKKRASVDWIIAFKLYFHTNRK